MNIDEHRMKALEKARVAKQESNGLVIHNPIVKWEQSNKKSRQLAIAANCASCMGCSETHMEPGFKKAISACTILNCPLWIFRPYQKKGELADEQIA